MPHADTLFQETYHRPTCKYMHIAGPKSGAGPAEHVAGLVPEQTASSVSAP